ncbi:hypothetical protein GCM10022223_28300 [Kineosporia mesophila]|uniref:ERCC4 domain-containing protein n=1 Tax=Kineosporia mesophila TaxID=566012 RepID=A0ABP6ZJB8_9ACTN|nr:hypothetical protein [Kineosporia mesophila]
MELVIARNPDPDSRLPYLLRLPLGEGLVFATKDTWPRTSALYCHPLPLDAWPHDDTLDEVEKVKLRVCDRRGAAIDIVADRTRESRTQIVFTHARGRQMVFWQSPRTRKQSRPDVRTPTARAAGISELEILVDAHEKYPYKFPQQAVTTTRKALTCGDYAIMLNDRTIAAVERKTMADLIGSLTGGRLRYALADLAALPRAAVVVEEPYSKVFAQDRVRPALVADGLAELQIAWPGVPIVFCDTRKLAEEWTYRWLSAARVWAGQEATLNPEPSEPEPSTKELRAWARGEGIDVPERGRLRPEVLAAWRAAQMPAS